MSSHVTMGLGVAGTFVSHPTVFIAMLKFVFFNGWNYPFYSVIFLNGALFLASICYFVYKLRYYQTLTSSFFIFNSVDMIKISFLFCGEWLFCAYSLFQPEMTVARYIMIASPFEFIFLGAQSIFRMHRPINPAHWISTALCIFGYAIFDLLDFRGGTEINWRVKYDAGWKGPLCCIASKLFHAVMTFQSKRMIMKKGFSEKFYMKKEMEEKRKQIDPDDLDENGFLKQTLVDFDSIIYKKSLMSRNKNENIKEGDIRILREQIEQKRKEMEDQKEILKKKIRKEIEEEKAQKRNFRFIQEEKPNPELQSRHKSRAASEVMRETKQQNIKENPVPHGGNQDAFEDEKLVEDRANRELRRLHAHDLKIFMEEKQKLEKMVDENKKKNMELEMMLVDYEELPFYIHFFAGMDDLQLSKMDDMIDSPFYDNELFGHTWESSFELYGIAGSLALFPLSCLCSYFTGEVPEAYQQMVGKRIDGPFGDGYAPLIVACFFSLLFAVRGPSLWKFNFAINRSLYYSMYVFTHIFILFYSVIFVDTSATLSATFGAGVMLMIIAYLAFYFVIDFTYSHKEANSNIELVKTSLPNSADGQYNVLEFRLFRIRRILGYDSLYRILVDMAVTKNHNVLLYTASPCIPTRVLFDTEYFQRIADWSGGYPRPFIEAIEKSWKSKDKIGIIIPNDPEIEKLAKDLKEAKKKEYEDKEAERKAEEKRKRDKIAEKEKIRRLKVEEEERNRIKREAEKIERAREQERAKREKEIMENVARKKASKEEKQKQLDVPGPSEQEPSVMAHSSSKLVEERPGEIEGEVFNFSKSKRE